MLTAKGYRERKWGPFPALRKALEGKQVHINDYRLTSADATMGDALLRLINIADLTAEYQSDVKEMAASLGKEEICKDLRTLEEFLEQASRFFKGKSEVVRRLYCTLSPDSGPNARYDPT